MVYFYLSFFSIVSKHIKWRSLSKQSFTNCHQLTSFDLDVPHEIFEPWDDWENEFEKLPQVSALCLSVF